MQSTSAIEALLRDDISALVTAQHRVIHNGTTYGIESLIDVRSGNRELVLMCQAVG